MKKIKSDKSKLHSYGSLIILVGIVFVSLLISVVALQYAQFDQRTFAKGFKGGKSLRINCSKYIDEVKTYTKTYRKGSEICTEVTKVTSYTKYCAAGPGKTTVTCRPLQNGN